MSFYAQGYEDILVKLGYNATKALTKIDLSKYTPERLGRAERNLSRTKAKYLAKTPDAVTARTPEHMRRAGNLDAMDDVLSAEGYRRSPAAASSAARSAALDAAAAAHVPGRTRASDAAFMAQPRITGPVAAVSPVDALAAAQPQAAAAAPARRTKRVPAAAQPQPVAAAQPQPTNTQQRGADTQQARTDQPTFLGQYGTPLALGGGAALAAGGLYAATRDKHAQYAQGYEDMLARLGARPARKLSYLRKQC